MHTQKGGTPYYFLVVIAIIFVSIGIYSFKTRGTVTPKQENIKSSEPIPSSLPEGEINWLSKPILIYQNDSLSVFPKKMPTLSGADDDYRKMTKLPNFFKVGSWIKGKYKGSDILDIQYTFPVMAGGSGDYHEIKRITFKDNQVVLLDIGLDDLKYYLDPNIKVSDVIFDQVDLPNLLSNGSNTFPIEYQGKKITFSIYPSGDFFTNLNNFVFLSSFAQGQKLYRKNQTGNFAWSNLETPYQAEDWDHSELKIDGEDGSTIPSYSKTTPQNWLIKPDLLSDLSPDSKSLEEIGYSTYFEIGCQLIPIGTLAKDTSFNPDDLKLVMTYGDNNYYQPTNADEALKSMYVLIKKAETNDSSRKAPSYERFVNSMPILIWKDSFGTYQILYRWRDYPGREGGCGKPVIYLYPEKPTNVSVKFTDKMALTKTSPSYNNGWRVFAKPDGQLTDLNTGIIYPNLFWEGASINPLPKKDEGFLIKKDNLNTFFEKTLKVFGLNTQEKQDFIDFWLPKLQEKPFYKISFYKTDEINSVIPLNISPHPDTIFRILMQYQGLDKEITIAPQELPEPFVRKGFTVVEWGGIFSK